MTGGEGVRAQAGSADGPRAATQRRADPLQARALHAADAGSTEVAADLLSRALEQDPDWTEGWWRYGGLLYTGGKYTEARVAFTHLVRLAPANSLGLALLGMTEYQLADWPNATLHLNKALAAGGLPAEISNGAMYAFARSLMRQGNRNGAIIALRLLQFKSPEYPALPEAFGSAELGFEAPPTPGSAQAGAVGLAGRAAIAVLRLQGDTAEQLYHQLIAQYPQQPFAHLCLGLFLENKGEHAAARQAFLEETAVNPTGPDAWIWLGRMALADRNAAETRMYSKRALALRPGDGVCYLLLGRSDALEGHWQDALDTLQKAEQLAPDSDEVHHALIGVYEQLHDPEGAAAERRLFSRAFALTHPPGTEGR